MSLKRACYAPKLDREESTLFIRVFGRFHTLRVSGIEGGLAHMGPALGRGYGFSVELYSHDAMIKCRNKRQNCLEMPLSMESPTWCFWHKSFIKCIQVNPFQLSSSSLLPNPDFLYPINPLSDISSDQYEGSTSIHRPQGQHRRHCHSKAWTGSSCHQSCVQWQQS